MDIKDNLVNGQCGTVVGIEKNAKGKIYSIIVDFDDPSCGAAQRQNHKNLSEKYNGTPIFQVQHEFQLASRRGWAHSARAKLRQFPLRLAYAQTAHKTQGQTIKAGNKMMIHWPKKMPENMGYVMFGRPERLEDLFVTGDMDIKDIRCNEDCLKETQRLQKVFEESEQVKRDKFANHWKISYLNVRSLNAHHKDVSNDNAIYDSDVLGLGETWMKKGETL